MCTSRVHPAWLPSYMVIEYRSFQRSPSCLKDHSCLKMVASDIVASNKRSKTLGLPLRRPNIALVTVCPSFELTLKLQRRCYLLINSGIALSKGNQHRTIPFFEQVDSSQILAHPKQNKFFTLTHFFKQSFQNTSLHS